MAEASYPRVLDFCLDHEGRGYEDVEGDPGGPTKAGITWKDYFQYLRETGRPVPVAASAVQHMTDADMAAIYRKHYWDPVRGAILPWPVDLAVFDAAVNCGVSRASKWLQGVLGVVQDGVIRDSTLGSVTVYCAKHGSVQLANQVTCRREEYYRMLAQSNPTLAKFLRGWIRRCDDVVDATLSSPPG